MTNRKSLTITVAMLDAGERAMLLCRDAGGHTPRSACHAIFQAMLAVSEWSPAIRVRPGDKRTPDRAAAHPLEWYAGKTLGPYVWEGFHAKSGLHYLRRIDPEKWIRLTDVQWERADALDNLQKALFYVSTQLARNTLGLRYQARHPKRPRQRKGDFDAIR